MTYEELKAEAAKIGYAVYKKPEYDCSCYGEYPNEAHRMKNGRWKCVEKYEPITVTDGSITGREGGAKHKFKTYCRRKGSADERA